MASTEWEELEPNSPFYLFIPLQNDLLAEYEKGWKVTDIFPVHGVGLTTARDHVVIDYESRPLLERANLFKNSDDSNVELCEKLNIPQKLGWSVTKARQLIKQDNNLEQCIIRILYRPFDVRYIFYHDSLVWRTVKQVMSHMTAKENIALTFHRREELDIPYSHFLCTRFITEHGLMSSKTTNCHAPLYLYPAEGEMNFDGNERRPNLNADFIKELEAKLGMGFRPHPLIPSPSTERGHDVAGASSPSLRAERETEGEVSELEGEVSDWHTNPGLWKKLKPVARQMRKEPTQAEDIMWQHLRDRQLLGFKFRRQHSIERFIVDFYCSEASLVIEIDGSIHQYTKEEDAIRQEYIESYGLRLLRFTNDEVLNNLDSVLNRIAEELGKPHPFNSSKTSSPCPPSPKSEKGVTASSPSLRAEREPEGEVFTPEDIFNYAYAVFHSPTYRTRYAEFLKIDFPRLPLTSDKILFKSLAEKGTELVSLHLMEAPILNTPITKYPIDGSHKVEKVAYDAKNQRVSINKTQYFEGVPPEVWEFHIGGYQVCHKWLKDRKDRTLSYDERVHYQKIVVALKETTRLMAEIDEVIPGWPVE
jgi:very-short-patch-repair endonuclease